MTSSIKNYDFYRKAVDGLQTKSVIGGISTLNKHTLLSLVSILSAIFISILTLSQLKSFIYPTTHTQLAIQDTLDLPVHTDIDIHFDNLKSNPPTDISVLLSFSYSTLDRQNRERKRMSFCRAIQFVSCITFYHSFHSQGEGNFHFALSRPDLEFGTVLLSSLFSFLSILISLLPMIFNTSTLPIPSTNYHSVLLHTIHLIRTPRI